jgi:predicted amino acid racemase
MPTVAIALDAIVHNTAAIVARCAPAGVEIVGVTKAACGHPLVARAMLRGGAAGLADSRLDNVRRLRRNGLDCPIMMLRIPSVSEADDVVRLCDSSLNSERATVLALSHAAVSQGLTHEVIVMLEMGDRREGVSADDLPGLCEAVLAAPGLELTGIGANFMCASGVLPTQAKLEALAAQAEAIEGRFGIRLRHVSGGNSANLPLMDAQPLPPRISQLRIGAAILRGEDVMSGSVLPGLRGDGFVLEAELIEIKTKPSMPEGETGRDAFGQRLSFTDRGDRVRGIVNLGRVDMRPEGLTPRDADVEVITASSDHLLLDLTEAKRFAVGDRLRFDMDYGALVQAMLSPYVDKRLVGRERIAPRPVRLRLFAGSQIAARPETRAFLESVAGLGLAIMEGGETVPGDLPLHVAPSRAGEPAIAEAELGVLVMDSEPGDIAATPPEATALFGLRAASPAQAALIRERGILALTMEDIDLIGVREAIRRALRRVTSATDGFALILHASVARGMAADAREEGLSYRECSLAMERIAASEGLRAITLSGLGGDAPAETLDAAYGYLLSALGKRILA